MKFGLLKHAGYLLVQISGINFSPLLLYFSIKSLIWVNHNCLFPVFLFLFFLLVAGYVCLFVRVWASNHLLSFSESWIFTVSKLVPVCVFLCFCWEYRYSHGVLGPTVYLGTPAKMRMCLWMHFHANVSMSSLASSHTAGCFDLILFSHTHTHTAVFYTHVLGSHHSNLSYETDFICSHTKLESNQIVNQFVFHSCLFFLSLTHIFLS